MIEVRPIQWADGRLRLLDQTRLPVEQVTLELARWRDAVEAIREMRVRGAPAIGVTAAYAMAMAAQEIDAPTTGEFLAQLKDAAAVIASARPTAVNLHWAVGRMLQVAEAEPNPSRIGERLLAEAQQIQWED